MGLVVSYLVDQSLKHEFACRRRLTTSPLVPAPAPPAMTSVRSLALAGLVATAAAHRPILGACVFRRSLCSLDARTAAHAGPE